MSSSSLSSTAVVAYSHCLRLCLRRLALCLRVLIDLASDRVFRRIFRRKNTRGSGYSVPPLEEGHILRFSVTRLAEKIRRREVSSEELVSACIGRLESLTPSLNFLVDRRYDAALEEARRTDRILASLGACEPGGVPPENVREEMRREAPLLGVPFSAPDGVRVKGMRHSAGAVALRHRLAPSDADAVRRLREAGAIPLCVSNVSEFGVWWGDCHNCAYGTTPNPHNTDRSAGGACGGEACLQSCCCTPFSLCADLRGGARTPAALCGLFAHKPTAGLTRCVGIGLGDHHSGGREELAAVSPMARHAGDLGALLEVLIGREKASSIGMDEEVFLTRLRFFYCDHPCPPSVLCSPPSPSVLRRLSAAVDFLEDHLGVAVEQMEGPICRSAAEVEVALSEAGAEGGTESDNQVTSVSHLLRSWLLWACDGSKTDAAAASTLPVLAAESAKRVRGGFARLAAAADIAKWGGRKKNGPLAITYQGNKTLEESKTRLRSLLGDDGVLLCPAHPTSAPFRGQSLTRPGNGLYAGLFGAMGFPATVAPLGTSEGLPVAIQIVASPYCDRLTLAVARALERPFGGWCPPFRDNAHDLGYDPGESFYRC